MNLTLREPGMDLAETFSYIDDVFGNELHIKMVESLSQATLGVIKSLSLAFHLIGDGLAQARQLSRKHCVKQVDRLFSNPNLNPWELFEHWVPFILAERKRAYVAMDWTDFDKDNHTTLMLSLVTSHGRATPLMWKTHSKTDLQARRNHVEDELLLRLRDVVPEDVEVVIIADRGFGDTALFDLLSRTLNFGYIIRFRENIYLTDANGDRRKASDWVGSGGRAKSIFKARLTKWDYEVPKVVCVKQPEMKDAWCLASSEEKMSPQELMAFYGKRWGIETSFRDIKDYRFGMGMGKMRTKSAAKRDRLFLVSALAIALLTMLGAAGDEAGLEKTIKVNTSKKRSYSFFSQGCIYYKLLPGVMKEWKQTLLMKFHEVLSRQLVFQHTLGIL